MVSCWLKLLCNGEMDISAVVDTLHDTFVDELIQYASLSMFEIVNETN